jgi:protein-tyrosine-phosphatase
MVRGAEVILVMSEELERALLNRFPVRRRAIYVLGDLDPASIDARGIRDPFEQELHVFEHTYARLDRCIAEFVRVVTVQRGAVAPPSGTRG